MKFLHTDDTNYIGSCATNVSAHTVQEIGHIHDVGFLCSIFNDRLPLCHRSCHHNVDGSSYRNLIQINMGSGQMLCLCPYQSMGNFHGRPHGTKSFDMQVDGAASDITASRKGNLRLFVFAEERTDQIIRCADSADELIVYRHIPNKRTIDFHLVLIDTLHSGSNLLDCLQQHIDVTHIRQIFYCNSLICHDGCSKNCKCSILGTSDFNFTLQRIPALDHVLFHFSPQKRNALLSILFVTFPIVIRGL